MVLNDFPNEEIQQLFIKDIILPLFNNANQNNNLNSLFLYILSKYNNEEEIVKFISHCLENHNYNYLLFLLIKKLFSSKHSKELNNLIFDHFIIKNNIFYEMNESLRKNCYTYLFEHFLLLNYNNYNVDEIKKRRLQIMNWIKSLNELNTSKDNFKLDISILVQLDTLYKSKLVQESYMLLCQWYDILLLNYNTENDYPWIWVNIVNHLNNVNLETFTIKRILYLMKRMKENLKFWNLFFIFYENLENHAIHLILPIWKNINEIFMNDLTNIEIEMIKILFKKAFNHANFGVLKMAIYSIFDLFNKTFNDNEKNILQLIFDKNFMFETFLEVVLTNKLLIQTNNNHKIEKYTERLFLFFNNYFNYFPFEEFINEMIYQSSIKRWSRLSILIFLLILKNNTKIKMKNNLFNFYKFIKVTFIEHPIWLKQRYQYLTLEILLQNFEITDETNMDMLINILCEEMDIFEHFPKNLLNYIRLELSDNLPNNNNTLNSVELKHDNFTNLVNCLLKLKSLNIEKVNPTISELFDISKNGLVQLNKLSNKEKKEQPYLVNLNYLKCLQIIKLTILNNINITNTELTDIIPLISDIPYLNYKTTTEHDLPKASELITLCVTVNGQLLIVVLLEYLKIKK
ncbi:hypothetical protein ABK040_000019 [Willaertia magna]